MEKFSRRNILTSKCNKYNHDLETLPNTYVAIDLELTGNDSLKYIIEASAIKVVDGQVVDEFSSLVKPPEYNILDNSKIVYRNNKHKKIKSTVKVDGEEIYYIDEFIEELTGISNNMIHDAEDEYSVIGKFYDFIGDHVVVGHGMANDILQIKDAFERVLDIDFNNPCIDTFDLAEFAYDDKFSLVRLCEYLGIENIDAHRARSDAYRTHLSYQRLGDHLKEKHGVEAYGQEFFKWMEKALLKQNRILKNRAMNNINAKNWNKKRQSYIDDHRLDLDLFNAKICLSNRIKLKNMPDFKRLANEYKLKLTTSLDLESDYYIVKNPVYDTNDLDKQFIKKVVDINKLGKSIRIMSINELTSILENFVSIDDGETDENSCTLDFKDKNVYLYNDFNYEPKENIGKIVEGIGGILVDEINNQTDWIIVGEGFDKPIFYDSKEYELVLAYLALGHNIKLVNEKKFWEFMAINEGEV